MNEKLTIMLVDDHPIFLKGLLDVLHDELPDADICPLPSSLEAIEFVKLKKPDVAILDLDMPVMNGLDLVTILQTQLPDLKVIILTMHKEPEIVRAIISKGVNGYVFKDDAVVELVAAIVKVLNGEEFVSASSLPQPKHEHGDLLSALTRTERLVLRCISEEKSSREIAEELSVSVKTIENHRNNISKKLQLKGSNSLLKFALANKFFC
jgi:two-component system, NarL family, response regulator DegU